MTEAGGARHLGPVGVGDGLSEVDSEEFVVEGNAQDIFFGADVESSDGEDGYLSNGEPDIPGNPEHMDFDTPEQRAAYQKNFDKYNRRRCRDGNQAPPERPAQTHDDDDDDDDDDDVNTGQEPAGREQAPIRMPRIPVQPTAEDIAAHKCTHLPHRDWCEVCVQARAREDKRFCNKDKSG